MPLVSDIHIACDKVVNIGANYWLRASWSLKWLPGNISVK